MQKKLLNFFIIAVFILFSRQSLAIESLAKTALVIDLSTNEVLLEKTNTIEKLISKSKELSRTYDDLSKDFKAKEVQYENALSNSNIHDSYPSYPSFIDHIMISSDLFEEDENGDVQTIRLGDYIAGYDEIISDHRPVVWRFTP